MPRIQSSTDSSLENAVCVRDLKSFESYARFSGVFLLRSRSLKTAKNGAPYLAIELGDSTGAFSSTVFNDCSAYSALAETREGGPVSVSGLIDFYADRFAPRIQEAEALPENSPRYQMALSRLVENSPENLDALWAELHEHIGAITHTGLRSTVASVFAETGEDFRVAPAAVSMHHAYRGGLIEHTLHMARAARALLPLYPEINPSLALAGILLHDTGKVAEYTRGLVTRRTRAGILHGHVVLGYALAHRHGLRTKLEASLLERLEHIILSHQGELEWGAAAQAATPEAVFVSMVDNLDARLGMVQKALRDAPASSEFSDRLPGLKAPLLLSPVE